MSDLAVSPDAVSKGRVYVFRKNLPLRVDQAAVIPLRVMTQVRAHLPSVGEAMAARPAVRHATAQAEQEQPLNVGLVIATSVALATLVPIALRQLRVVRHLPDPGSHTFNSDRVVTSHRSKVLGVPDSLLGLASYGSTLALILLSPKNAVARKLVGPKLVVDTTMAGVNTVRQFAGFRKVCSWCLLTVGATAAMAVVGRKELKGIGR